MTWDIDEKYLAPNALWQDNHICMLEHQTARNQAVAKHGFQPGETIFSDAALATVLLPDQKGIRCDACFRCSTALKRCSGCVEYWYCGKDCQCHHWKTIHKHMCKAIPNFRATAAFQASPVHEQTDAFLLGHLLAEHRHRLLENDELPPENLNDPLGTFASLLPLCENFQHDGSLFCPSDGASRVSPAVVKELSSRFNNNNFIVHCHLAPIGHGIFPLASRLFNHSCVPNAIVTYVFLPNGVRMVIKALTGIKAGAEVTIPYFDPALPFQRRQEICRYSYGFECDCSSCSLCKSLGNAAMPSTNAMQSAEIENLLLEHAYSDAEIIWPSQPLLFTLPPELRVVLHEDFLPRLSKTFNDAAHDGHYDVALRSGLVLLALYLVIYPARFPQIGVHCLEVAKTAWNASVRNQRVDSKGEAELLTTSRQFLSLAVDSLSVLGKESDSDSGPLNDCKVLDELLNSS